MQQHRQIVGEPAAPFGVVDPASRIFQPPSQSSIGEANLVCCACLHRKGITGY